MKTKITVLIITFIVVLAGYHIYEKEKEGKEEYFVTGQNTETNKASDDTAKPDNSDNKEDTDDYVTAFICGEVSEPGVYRVKSGARIIDVLDVAGGFTEYASNDYVNLAQVVNDGMKIYIPSREEIQKGTINTEIFSGEGDTYLVNINTADAKTLTSLPGIGETKADAILTYREKNGRFEKVEDIMDVSGIGESTFENIRDLITVGE